MNTRYIFPCLSALLILISTGGCGKHDTTLSSQPAEPFAMSPDTVARIHWIGKNDLSVKAGAYYFMRIWGVPSGRQLETQTINKLSVASSKLATPADPKLQTLSPEIVQALLFNFYSDILQNESLIEVRQPVDRPVEYALAIRLDNTRANFWETNLAVLLQSFTGTFATLPAAPERGWSLKRQNSPGLIQLKRVAGWIIVSAAQDKSSALEDIASRISRYQKPFTQSETNWLEANIDPQRFAAALSLKWTLPRAIPRINISLTGDGGNVLARGEAIFPPEVKIEPEPWNIPTKLIHEPLNAFSAVRGIRQPLDSWQPWKELGLGTPDQFFSWSEAEGPFRTFLAAPLPGAGDQVHQLTGRLLSRANPWLSARGYVAFDPMANSNGVTWGNLPTLKPFITSTPTPGGDFVFGGLFPEFSAGSNAPGGNSVLQDLARQTNVIYYNWELTGARLEPWLQIGQLARNIAHRGQLPINTLALNWLGLIRYRLGESTTQVTLSGPHQLSFYRRSTVGLTAPELQLFVDWLESPQFPAGLHSTLTPP